MTTGTIDIFGGAGYNTNYVNYVNNAITAINGGPQNLSGKHSTNQPVATITNAAAYNNGQAPSSTPIDTYNFTFPFNPNALTWEYDLVTASFDTIGGRVVQILSTNIQTMTFDGDAGSRTALIKMYENMKTVQDNQVTTYQPSLLTVPLRDSGTYTFLVWLRSIPKMGWEVETTTYPYQIEFEVQEDFNALSNVSSISALNFLDDQLGIGYNPIYSGASNKATVEALTSDS